MSKILLLTSLLNSHEERVGVRISIYRLYSLTSIEQINGVWAVMELLQWLWIKPLHEAALLCGCSLHLPQLSFSPLRAALSPETPPELLGNL